MHTISEVAKKAGTTIRALRFYEQQRLLSPAREDGRRLYSDAEIERIGRIVRWRNAGFQLNDVSRLLILLDRGQVDEAREYELQVLEKREAEVRKMSDAIEACRQAA